MNLSKALQLRTEYGNNIGIIKINDDGYICLNDLASFFPNKRLDNWLANDSTKDFIEALEKTLIPGKSGIIAKKGRNGGTYAHQLIAFKFALWMSPEFEIKVYSEYIEGTQHKKDWNIKRILAANNYKMLVKAAKNAHEQPQSYHYSNDALMINEIVFGVRFGDVRDTATEMELDAVADLEARNATLIDLGMEYQERKEKLKMMFEKNNIKLLYKIKEQ